MFRLKIVYGVVTVPLDHGHLPRQRLRNRIVEVTPHRLCNALIVMIEGRMLFGSRRTLL
jgi:hypothetical protein